jgi:hypothetical protein
VNSDDADDADDELETGRSSSIYIQLTHLLVYYNPVRADELRNSATPLPSPLRDSVNP